MCEICDELRDKIERCSFFIDHVLDQITIGRLKTLRSEYEAQMQKVECKDKK